MKLRKRYARYDAVLHTDRCSARNNADLTLTLRMRFRQINPAGNAPVGTYNDYGSPRRCPAQDREMDCGGIDGLENQFCRSIACRKMKAAMRTIGSLAGRARWLVVLACSVWLASFTANAQRLQHPSVSKMTKIPCEADALSRSVCMIRYVLDDVVKASGGASEGGIAQIKAASSTSYTVSLPREERIQSFTDEFAVQGDALTFVRRIESTHGF